MPGHKKLEQRAAVKRLAMRGLTYKDIADILGISLSATARTAQALMSDGEIPDRATRHGVKPAPAPMSHLRNLEERCKVRRGNMYDVLLPLTNEQREWLFKQAPKGTKLAELVRAIIVDAYEEETNA